jgi:membrane protein involved in colicin uptake
LAADGLKAKHAAAVASNPQNALAAAAKASAKRSAKAEAGAEKAAVATKDDGAAAADDDGGGHEGPGDEGPGAPAAGGLAGKGKKRKSSEGDEGSSEKNAILVDSEGALFTPIYIHITSTLWDRKNFFSSSLHATLYSPSLVVSICDACVLRACRV